MEFDFPVEDENDALLVALMEEIDAQLEESPAEAEKLQENSLKNAEVEVVLAAETESATEPDQG